MEYIDAKKDVLKSLSNKMFNMEMSDYKKKKKKKKKDEPVMAEVEIEVTKSIPMDKKADKGNDTDKFKEMVQSYFKDKKSDRKPAAREIVIGSDMRKPKQAPKAKKKRVRKAKKYGL